MSLLSELKPVKKSISSPKRIGRGNGSGWGTTAARGYKGQKARSGSKSRATFEGGQMPLWQRLPKFGFKSISKTKYQLVSLDRIMALSEQESLNEITPQVLQAMGLVKKQTAPIKILKGRQPFSKAFHIKANAFSVSAKDTIEKAGGKVEVVKTCRA